MAKGRTRISRGARARVAAVVAAAALLFAGRGNAQAQPAPSLSLRDLQVVVRALGFLQPPPANNAWMAVVFAPGSAASRQDAERIAALFGDGLRAGGGTLRARPVPADALPAGGFAALIAAAGAPGEALLAAARAHRVACVTSVMQQVEAGQCTFWVRSEPRVEIVVSRAATAASGIALAAAFRLMVREI